MQTAENQQNLFEAGTQKVKALTTPNGKILPLRYGLIVGGEDVPCVLLSDLARILGYTGINYASRGLLTTVVRESGSVIEGKTADLSQTFSRYIPLEDVPGKVLRPFIAREPYAKIRSQSLARAVVEAEKALPWFENKVLPNLGNLAAIAGEPVKIPEPKPEPELPTEAIEFDREMVEKIADYIQERFKVHRVTALMDAMAIVEKITGADLTREKVVLQILK